MFVVNLTEAVPPRDTLQDYSTRKSGEMHTFGANFEQASVPNLWLSERQSRRFNLIFEANL
jgi:hypothetical protein